jgi:hypothetical protein
MVLRAPLPELDVLVRLSLVLEYVVVPQVFIVVVIQLVMVNGGAVHNTMVNTEKVEE